MDQTSAVEAANEAFYAAFERRDLDALSDLWEHSDRTFCTHPGWPRLQGWGAIASSFAALFASGQSLQFILTECRVQVSAGAAWVSVDENLLGDQGGSTVAALNLFVPGPGGWRMVGHHGSPVNVTRA